jgi:hypothetical protein
LIGIGFGTLWRASADVDHGEVWVGGDVGDCDAVVAGGVVLVGAVDVGLLDFGLLDSDGLGELLVLGDFAGLLGAVELGEFDGVLDRLGLEGPVTGCRS